MKKFESVGARLTFLLVALSPLLALSASSFASGVPQYIAVCEQCTLDEEFAYAAASEVPDPQVGDGIARIYPVYVVNSNSNRVMFFQVHVQRDEGTVTPFAHSTGYEFGTYKVAYPADGDPAVEAAILEAVPIAFEFASSIGGNLQGDDITNIGSAVDLVGPNDSEAGYNRNQLMADINDHYDSYWNSLLLSASDLTSRIAGKVFGSDAIVLIDSVITIEFPDGTKIDVKIDEILEGAFSTNVHLELTVLPHTAELPDGRVIPQTAGQFSGFDWSGNSSSNLGLRLARLAALYGLDVGEPNDDPLDCTFTCDANGDCTLNCS